MRHMQSYIVPVVTVRVKDNVKVSVKQSCKDVNDNYLVINIVTVEQHVVDVMRQSNCIHVTGKLKRYHLMNSFNLKHRRAVHELIVKLSMLKHRVKRFDKQNFRHSVYTQIDQIDI